ncbi:hypothetical protein [Deinococcus misasensis]|uniref:hypothetical protein n=1 Tax=Deinococcus misasensis TaxID=392413 RepID=UPI00054EA31C|nr:hypothetical protein [Deinococcus misasensis]
MEKRIAARAVDEVAEARLLHAQISKAALQKGTQILRHNPAEKGNFRDAARLIQVGLTGHRQALGLDRPEFTEGEYFDRMRDEFMKFLTSEGVGFTAEEAKDAIRRFVLFLKERGV